MSGPGRETPDQARTRRRWITLAELVAVAGVVIAALGFWNSWSERRDAAAERAADRAATAASEARTGARADLTATVEDNGRRLLLKDARHDLQSVTVTFPKALAAPRQEPVADPVIEAAGIEAPLLKLTDGGPDDREGRMPVLVTARWVDGDAPRAATDTYDLIWKTEGRFARGRALRLEGLRLRQRGGTQARIDRLWTKP